jgi:cell division protein FtsB
VVLIGRRDRLQKEIDELNRNNQVLIQRVSDLTSELSTFKGRPDQGGKRTRRK